MRATASVAGLVLGGLLTWAGLSAETPGEAVESAPPGQEKRAPEAAPPPLERIRRQVPDWDALMGTRNSADRAKLFTEYFEPRYEQVQGRGGPVQRESAPPRVNPGDDEWVAVINAMTAAGTTDELKEKLMRIVQARHLAERVPDFVEVCLDTSSPVAWSALRLFADIAPPEQLRPVLRGALKGDDGMKYTALQVIGRRCLADMADDVAALLDDPIRGPAAASLLGGFEVESAEPAIRAEVERRGKYDDGWMSYYATTGRGRVPAVLLDRFRDRFVADYSGSGYVMLADSEDPAALDLLRSLRDRWAEKGRFDDGREMPRQSLQAALVMAGDETAIPAFIDHLRERLRLGSWYQSDFDAMNALNRFTFPALYNRRFADPYPLRSGTVDRHVEALSKWTGVRFTLSDGVLREQVLSTGPTKRLPFLFRWACYGGVCVVGADEVRVVTREEAARHWIRHFTK